ncbi:hypothetical protein C0583_05445 [Candidatus Parcubacteria bacterium]|nr:MAG: hypothetical protein C0583_05445 [Candidatus Parcubacteria bacterium]
MKRLLFALFICFGVLLSYSADLDFFGFYQMDMIYDSSQTHMGDAVYFVKPTGGTDNDEFTFTARQTRFGFKTNTVYEDNSTLNTMFAVDFFGKNDSNISEHMRMRHAFIQYKNGSETFIMGQHNDLFSGLYPNSVDASGRLFINVGFRRPMFIYQKNSLSLAMARAYSLDAVSEALTSLAESPDFQFKYELNKKLSFSGVFGKREIPGVRTDMYGISAEYSSKNISAEIYSGEALAGYFGSIGYDIKGVEAEECSGGWLNYKKGDLSIGIGAQINDDENLAVGDRESNSMVFVSRQIKIKPDFFVIPEISYYKTGYKNASDVEDIRFSLSSRFYF